ncbi:Serine carboxypeptidase-like [Vitis vinifera]|uniref:Serine carboxypeptidase-like n=1 Tax=Vitis vinifera TaxID=29760 RepID=A0A438ILV5_VITVI|nr:Serine carboxypeptidase-like [Vitis vinifera]
MLGQGFAIGNGLTNPQIQYKAYTDYALEMGMIEKTDYDRINKVLPVCEMAIKLCGNFFFFFFFFTLWFLLFPFYVLVSSFNPSVCAHIGKDDKKTHGVGSLGGSAPNEAGMEMGNLFPGLNLFLSQHRLWIPILDEEFDLLTGIPCPCPAYSRMENGVGMGNKFTSGDGDREPPPDPLYIPLCSLQYYDIRKTCEGSLCYDFSNMEKFLNQKPVRAALGVGDIEFVPCSPAVYQALLMDWMRNLEVGIPDLLDDGIKLFVYAGEYDLICNWLGNSRWVHAMEWGGQLEFQAAPEVPFVIGDSKAGLMKIHGPLTFLKVHDAGHMVPMDQPRVALEMLKRWFENKLPENTPAESKEPEERVAQM